MELTCNAALFLLVVSAAAALVRRVWRLPPAEDAPEPEAFK